MHKLKKSGGVTFGNDRPMVSEMVCYSTFYYEPIVTFLKMSEKYLPTVITENDAHYDGTVFYRTLMPRFARRRC